MHLQVLAFLIGVVIAQNPDPVQVLCGDSLIDLLNIFGHPPTLQSKYLFKCPVSCPSSTPEEIWASQDGWYTMDSELCAASGHGANIAGGTPFQVSVKIDLLTTPRIATFPSSSHNGHVSQTWGRPYPVVFRVDALANPPAALLQVTTLVLSDEVLRSIYDTNEAKDKDPTPTPNPSAADQVVNAGSVSSADSATVPPQLFPVVMVLK